MNERMVRRMGPLRVARKRLPALIDLTFAEIVASDLPRLFMYAYCGVLETCCSYSEYFFFFIWPCGIQSGAY